MKLTEEDIEVFQWNGVTSKGLHIKIYVDERTGFGAGVAMKQQILETQEIVEKVKRLRINRIVELMKGRPALTDSETVLDFESLTIDLKELLTTKEKK